MSIIHDDSFAKWSLEWSPIPLVTGRPIIATSSPCPESSLILPSTHHIINFQSLSKLLPIIATSSPCSRSSLDPAQYSPYHKLLTRGQFRGRLLTFSARSSSIRY